MNNTLISFYTSKIEEFNTQLSKIKKTLFASSMLRLVVFVIAVFAGYFFRNNNQIVIGVILLTIILFVFLVSRHADLKYKRDKLKALISINENEIKILNRDFLHMPDGGTYKNPEHYYSQDIDLFGIGSFYQYSNRTALTQGSDLLATLFTENTIADIKIKQEAIIELSEIVDWRQEFSAIASLVKTETPHKSILKWLSGYQSFVPNIMKYLPLVFSAISVVTIGLYFLDIISGWLVVGWLFIGLGITGRYLKKINKLSADTGRIQSTFLQYQKLILEIEKKDFSSVLLKEKKGAIVSKSKTTSKILKDFASILGALDQRNNMIFGFLGNAFLLWDLQQCYKLEHWINKYSESVDKWFATIAFFDAYNSLGNFSHNHPRYSFPTIIDNKKVIQARGAAHPLLDPNKAVTNPLNIDSEQFFIITGANMAGKSTFLRTVSLQIVMANVGLPVCAKEMEYTPTKLITSMRTTDSLTDDESYFFSELKRLKFIVDQITTDHYFIVLDEILKGTNSTDKAIGSRKFVERLVKSNATGIIATHDLSLCELSDSLPEVENFYFDAQIIDNELHFDYKFKDGICKNMNASFLLKKMDIV